MLGELGNRRMPQPVWLQLENDIQRMLLQSTNLKTTAAGTRQDKTRPEVRDLAIRRWLTTRNPLKLWMRRINLGNDWKSNAETKTRAGRRRKQEQRHGHGFRLTRNADIEI